MKSIFVALFILVFSAGSAWSQDTVELITTNNPEGFALEFMSEVESEGVVRAKRLFSDLGLSNPQHDGIFSYYVSMQGDQNDRWSKIMGSVNNAGALNQVYAYAYLGNNVWTFWRFDFMKINDDDWAVANVIFNSDYNAVLAQNFGFLE